MKRWWAVGVCECGVGDKAVPGEEHSQITTLIQQRQAIYKSKGKQTLSGTQSRTASCVLYHKQLSLIQYSIYKQ